MGNKFFMHRIKHDTSKEELTAWDKGISPAGAECLSLNMRCSIDMNDIDRSLEKLEKHELEKVRLQKMIQEIYDLRPSTAYNLVMIIEKIAEVANTEYKYGKQDLNDK